MVDLNERERAMLRRLSEAEGAHFRHQLRGEAPLSMEEKIDVASDLLRRNPGEFLARYHRFLQWPVDAECFRDHWDDYTVRYYLKEVIGISFFPSHCDSTYIESFGSESDSLKRRRELRVKNRRLVVGVPR